MKLYSGILSMFGAKIEIAMFEKSIDHELIHVPFSLSANYEPKHPEVLRINPKGQVPVLVDGALELFDSTQIFEYLEDIAPSPPLWPSAPRERARARLLELRSDEVFFPNVAQLFPRNRMRDGEEIAAAATAAIHEYYAAIERELVERDYLATDFGYADIAFFAAHYWASLVGASPHAELRRLAAWRDRVGARHSVRTVLGRVASYLSEQGLVPPPIDGTGARAA